MPTEYDIDSINEAAYWRNIIMARITSQSVKRLLYSRNFIRLNEIEHRLLQETI